VKISRDTLLSELRFVARASERATEAHPILTYALWTVDDERIHLRATDLETTAETWVDTEGAGPAVSLAVPAAASVAVLADMLDDQVTLEISASDWKISDDSGRARLAGLAAEEFPEQPALEGGGFEVETARLRAAIEATRHAGSATTLQSSPTGFALMLADPLTMAATDGHRGAVSGDLSALAAGEEGPLLRLPANSVKLMESALQGDKVATFRYDDRRISVSTGDRRRISFRRIEGGYPALHTVIAKQRGSEHKFTADRATLLAASRAAVSCPGLVDHTVVVEVTESGLEVWARSDYADVRRQCAAEIAGPPAKLGVNGMYFVELLESIVGKEITIHYVQDGPFYYESTEGAVGEWRVLMPKRI